MESVGWMARRLRSATLCRASLRYGGERISAVREKKCRRHRQIGWRMALYLRGKISVSTNDLSPKEATAMSRDIKYIGMDVHQEAIVIAVLNGSGKLVMETILETKASQANLPAAVDVFYINRGSTYTHDATIKAELFYVDFDLSFSGRCQS
jgi:hypothetical protein